MPFDGSCPAPDILVLQRMLAFFEAEDSWCPNGWHDDKGRVCIVQAMHTIGQELRIANCETLCDHLSRAILQNHPQDERLKSFSIIRFNDTVCSDIEEVRDTIRLAMVFARESVAP